MTTTATNQNRNLVTRRYCVSGKLTTRSPVILGSGQDERTDTDCIRDWAGNIFIPGTTLAGCLRHILKPCIQNQEVLDRVFGTCEDGAGQSRVIFSDAVPTGTISTSIRDGIKLDPVKKTSIPKAKYDYEVVDTGQTFCFRMEAVARQRDSAEEVQQLEAILAKTIDLLKNSIFVGAKTTRGFGKIQLSDVKIAAFDLPEEIDNWLEFDWDTMEGVDKLEPNAALFRESKESLYKVTFRIIDSVIIRAYSTDPAQPDSASLTMAGNPVIPGTSWAGAIRHALIRAAREMGCMERMDQLVRQMFGKAADEPRDQGRASLIAIEESVIKEGTMLTCRRTKIDRFTGGVVDGALFDEIPVYGGTVDLVFRLREPEDYLFGMLILAVKEFEHGIQSIGGGGMSGAGDLNSSPPLKGSTWMNRSAWEHSRTNYGKPHKELGENQMEKLFNYIKKYKQDNDTWVLIYAHDRIFLEKLANPSEAAKELLLDRVKEVRAFDRDDELKIWNYGGTVQNRLFSATCQKNWREHFDTMLLWGETFSKDGMSLIEPDRGTVINFPFDISGYNLPFSVTLVNYYSYTDDGLILFEDARLLAITDANKTELQEVQNG